MTKETIFLSYARVDMAFALKLAEDLKNSGSGVWIDQASIKAGNRWDASIEAALNDASRLIIVLSPASVASNNVMDEVSFALENKKIVIPVLLTECTMPFRLRRLQRIDFTSDYRNGISKLLEALREPAIVQDEESEEINKSKKEQVENIYHLIEIEFKIKIISLSQYLFKVTHNVHVFMLVWDLKYVRPATELVLKTDLFLYSNHKLKRSHHDAAWGCKMLIALPSSHTSINTNVACCTLSKDK